MWVRRLLFSEGRARVGLLGLDHRGERGATALGDHGEQPPASAATGALGELPEVTGDSISVAEHAHDPTRTRLIIRERLDQGLRNLPRKSTASGRQFVRHTVRGGETILFALPAPG